VGLPTGRVTFVFTDIEGSTKLLRHLGDEAYRPVLERHRELIRQAATEHDGTLVNMQGDACFLAFSSTDAAAAACAQAQRLLAAEAWPPSTPVRVRMGVHSGLANPRADDYVALAVHQATRVMSAGHGGQVLLSEHAVEELSGDGALTVVPVGRYTLRDFDEPVRLHQLAGPGLAEDFPAVRALPSEGHNLVLPRTPLVGRATELSEVASTVQPGRIVTLVGPGGVGKTRLALELGVRIAPAWADGVWFTDLGPVDDPSRLPATIAVALGMRAESSGDRADDVLAHVRSRNVLVLLDNCEHLVEACAAFAERLLASGPGVGVLATSREPLHVRGETVTRVQPLALPPSDPTSVEEACSWPSVQLFVDRAAAARPGFRLDDSSEHVVVEICRHLDGLPLALEVAASRVNVMTPAAILDGLSDQLRLLRSRDRSLPPRQRTMEALLDWSDHLLEVRERTAWRRLAIFGGSFSIDTATVAVAGEDVEPDDVAELVWSLVDRSLVVVDLTANDTRYRLLETVRAHARRQLVSNDEEEPVARRLAEWYIDRLGPHQPGAVAWIGELGTELDNVRALIPVLQTGRPALAQVLAVTVARYHDSVGTYRDGVDEVSRYATDLDAPTPERVGLLGALADLQLRTGDTGAELVDQAEALVAAVGPPPWDDVAVLRSRGEIAVRTGDLAAAIQVARQGLALGPSQLGRARLLNLLGIASALAGDLDTAATAFQDELEAYQENAADGLVASTLNNLAEVSMRRGDMRGAAENQRDCLALALQLGQPALVAYSLITAARIAAGRDLEAAVRLETAAEHLLQQGGLHLYDEDRRLCEELLAAGREQLGPTRFAAALADGRALDIPAAAHAADAVLASASTWAEAPAHTPGGQRGADSERRRRFFL